MKRKLSMILALSTTLTMLAACSNTNDSAQAELDKDLLVNQSTSAAATETDSEQDNSTSEKTNKEITSAETVAIAESTPAEPVTYENIEMPVPFENEGGDLNSDFYSTVDLKLGYIDMSFVNMVGVEEFESWLNSTSSSTSELTSVGEVANLYSFIKHFDISNDVVRENLVNMRNGSADDFSDEEIDLITSDNDEAVAAHFAAETTITKGGNIYSLKWIYYHSPEDYSLNGITAEELEATLPMFNQFTFTNEAKQAIEMKINSYAAVSASDFAE